MRHLHSQGRLTKGGCLFVLAEAYCPGAPPGDGGEMAMVAAFVLFTSTNLALSGRFWSGIGSP